MTRSAPPDVGGFVDSVKIALLDGVRRLSIQQFGQLNGLEIVAKE